MMNHHMPAGSGHQHHSSNPTHNAHYSQTQRQRDYHAYYSHPPQSPIHPSQYSGAYYPHAPQQYYPAQYQGYPQQRWTPHPQMPYPQQYMPQHAPPPMSYYQRPPYDVTAEFRPNSRQSGPPQYPQSPAVPPPQSPSSRPPTSSASQEQGKVEEARPSIQPPEVEQPAATNPLQEEPEHKTPFRPELPWYSPTTSALAFPPRAALRRRKRTALVADANVVLPSRGGAAESPAQSATPEASERTRLAEDISSEASTVAAPSDAETPATSHAPSESECRDSTPTTPAPASEVSPKPTPTQSQQHQRRDTRAAVAVPVLPNLTRHKAAPSVDKQPGAVNVTEPEVTSVEEVAPVEEPPKPIVPKSWADLVRIQGAKAQAPVLTTDGVNGNVTAKNATLSEALKQYVVSTDQISFFEPRGLVNTGNMCYMNSILQILVFCVPFFSFLDQVRSRTVHSIKSDTPLLDAMIMFMRELKIVASADSVNALRKTLKPAELEKYGDPITPEYIYDAIKHLPRFQSMRRGHQQDAEEFLGFVLEGLHDECIAVMQGDSKPTETTETSSEQGEGDGWLEVGPKQKAAITRTAGQQDAPSPVTKIFGGNLRSELRVPGQKDSVTLEPYKPLQLDIGAPHINSIIDALKNITHAETLTGDFGGRGNTAKKQVFIDSLPPVLILHLKRFQFDNNLTGTQKIWKKIGYPLELEIPKEVFPQSKRSGFAGGKPLPRYRLTSVVYHHGKSAAGGHYTVDVLRQDFKEWVRIDDTFIRRIRPEDVAEGGAGEDPKILARALEQHRAAQELQKQRNMYEGLEEDEQTTPWSEVNGHADKKVKPVNGGVSADVATPGSTTGKRTPTAKREGVKDNKVAYILLYECIDL